MKIPKNTLFYVLLGGAGLLLLSRLSSAKSYAVITPNWARNPFYPCEIDDATNADTGAHMKVLSGTSSECAKALRYWTTGAPGIVGNDINWSVVGRGHNKIYLERD